jgi:hypothetical protein
MRSEGGGEGEDKSGYLKLFWYSLKVIWWLHMRNADVRYM